MRKIISTSSFFLIILFFFSSCGADEDEKQKEAVPAITTEKKEPMKEKSKGFGEVTKVELETPLEQERIHRGKSIYDMKCSACHKLNADRLVGPGWAGVTKRRSPEWIMNMITNVDVMLDKDADAQKLLELCLTRMPNQNVSIGDARDVLEFMRQNDGE